MAASRATAEWQGSMVLVHAADGQEAGHEAQGPGQDDGQPAHDADLQEAGHEPSVGHA